MSLVKSVEKVEAFNTGLQLIVAAVGSVPTWGWSDGALIRRVHPTPPADGFQEFDFVALPPRGRFLQASFPIAAVTGFYTPDPWLRGVRVRARDNALEASILDKAADQLVEVLEEDVRWKTTLAHFEDSWQPTGNTKIVVDGWSTRLSVEMKKLRHELVLTVEGPDKAKIDRCFREAIAVGLVAAIVAAYSTGGAVLSAAISAFLAQFEGCLGNSFDARVDDKSHWETWWT